VLLLPCAIAALVRLSHGPVRPSRFLQPWCAAALSALDTVVTAYAAGLVSCINASIEASLPVLSGGTGALELYFSGSLVAAVMITMLPLWLQSHPQAGRLGTGTGLILLAVTCVLHTTVFGFKVCLVARAIGALANILIVSCALHTAMLQKLAGWRASTVVCGLVLGSALGPLSGELLTDLLGLQGTLAVFSVAAMTASCAYVAISIWVTNAQARLSPSSSSGSIWRSVSDLALHPRLRLLVSIVGLCSALLALHNTSMPLHLREVIPLTESPYVAIAEGGAHVLLAAGVLCCGAICDKVSEPRAVNGMLTAIVTSILGLRAIAGGQANSHPSLAITGLITSNVGLGGLLGISLPWLAYYPQGCSVAQRVPTAAVIAVAAFAFWILGEASSIATQIFLTPVIGHSSTILIYSGGLVLHAGMLFCGSQANSSKKGLETQPPAELLGTSPIHRNSHDNH